VHNGSSKKALKELKLQGNGLTGQGLVPLFNALTPKSVKNLKPTHQHLVRLDLHESSLTAEAVRFLAKLLELNKTLEHLRLGGISHLEDKCIKQIG